MQQYHFQNLYQIIEKNIQISPHKTAIYEEDLKISTLEFKNKIDSVAEYLHQINVLPNDKVAILMSNSWQFIVNLFAINKVGAIAIPVNNFLKEEEITYILNDCEASVLFCSFKFANEVQNILNRTKVKQIIWVDGHPVLDHHNIAHHDILNIKSKREPFNKPIDDNSFILYTSGTTGKPKGAMLSCKNIFSNCEGARILMNAQEDSKLNMLCYLPMFHAFTFTVTVILPLYSNSSVIVIRSIAGIKDFKKLLKQLLIKRCRYFIGVPDIYKAMSKAKLPWCFHMFHNVRGFISGAAPLSDEVSRSFSNNFKRGMLLQGYGISECSPVVSCNSPEANKFGSVGKPLNGYEIKIMDENFKEIPIGEIGEICVKGDCVMMGYYKKPEDTKKAIIDGWFRTGDLGKVDEEGFIYIVDRLKDLIIHKGMNIYPREIEEILCNHPKINACAVIGIKDETANEIPIAYVEPKDGLTITESEVKEFLKPKLAVFKTPRKVITLDKLPRNATGKILKRELRDLYQTNKHINT